jgi:hypothetical protein
MLFEIYINTFQVSMHMNFKVFFYHILMCYTICVVKCKDWASNIESD